MNREVVMEVSEVCEATCIQQSNTQAPRCAHARPRSTGDTGAPGRVPAGRRGPALGGVYLGISTAISQTRGFVPMSARQSVHGMPVIAGAAQQPIPPVDHTATTWAGSRKTR